MNDLFESPSLVPIKGFNCSTFSSKDFVKSICLVVALSLAAAAPRLVASGNLPRVAVKPISPYFKSLATSPALEPILVPTPLAEPIPLEPSKISEANPAE